MNEKRSNVDHLISELTHSDYDRVSLAREALIGMGQPIIAELVSALENASDREAWLLINILSQIGHRDALPAVIEFLNSENRAIQAICAQFIATVGDHREVPVLLAALSRLPESSAAIWIIQALGQMGDLRSVPLLMQVVEETESPIKRYSAIEALGLLGDPKCLELVARFTEDENHHVRSRAIYAVELLSGHDHSARMA